MTRPSRIPALRFPAVPLPALALGALGLLAAGCASVGVTTESDASAPFASYRTWDWVAPDDNSEDPRFPGLRKAGRERIAAALEAKGYQHVEAGKSPDFRVQFYAFIEEEKEPVVEEEEDVQQAETPEPELPPARTRTPAHPRPIRNEHEATGTADILLENVELDALETGDLVVEAVDGKSWQLVWRGRGRGVADPKKPQPELLRALDKVVGRFPDAGFGLQS